jgi:adenine/guanine phosphoribosyltransferase-like PRPP-binding protein
MLDWQRVIKEETEKCEMTTFPTEDGKGTYPYVILPFDSRITPKFMRAITKGMSLMLKDEIKKATAVLLPEAKGFLLSPIIETFGLDLALVRKRNYRTKNQIVIEQRKAYKDKEAENLMYCVGLKKGDVPLIVDDIISTGGTQISIINALKEHGFDIAGIGVVYERGNGIEEIKRQTGYDAKALARLEIIDKKLPSGEIVKRPFVSKIFGVE